MHESGSMMYSAFGNTQTMFKSFTDSQLLTCKQGFLVLYWLDPKVPRFYVEPIRSMLKKQLSTPMGDTGATNFKPSARTWADLEAPALYLQKNSVQDGRILL